MSNFENILDRGWKELPEPQPLPDGKYLLKGRFASAKEWENKDGDEGAIITFTDEVVKAYDSDTAAQVNGSDIRGKAVDTTIFVMNEEDERKVWNELTKRGLDVEEAGSLADALKASRGQPVVGSVRTRHYETKDGQPAYRNFTVKTEAVSL